jgi:hypothetical protein
MRSLQGSGFSLLEHAGAGNMDDGSIGIRNADGRSDDGQVPEGGLESKLQTALRSKFFPDKQETA